MDSNAEQSPCPHCGASMHRTASWCNICRRDVEWLPKKETKIEQGSHQLKPGIFSTHVRFLMHILLVGLFVPIAMYTIAAENYLRLPEGLFSAFFFAVVPYWLGIKLYPYNEDFLRIKLDFRLTRFLITIAIPNVIYMAMAYIYDLSDESVLATLSPLIFYFGIYFYLRMYWKDLFTNKP